MNRAHRGRGAAAGRSTEEVYLAGDRVTALLPRDDLATKPDSALLKWAEPGGTIVVLERELDSPV